MSIKFNNSSFLDLAMNHRSVVNHKNNLQSNERLEFLGDSILSFLTSQFLYAHFPKKKEGELTTMRSLLVQKKTLSLVAKRIGLDKLIHLSKSEDEAGGRDNENILADCFESFLAAIFLDQGLTAAQKFIEEELLPLLPEVEKMRQLKDFKSQLQEIIQAKNHQTPYYQILNEEGPDHNKMFTAGVFCGKTKIGEGKGHTKQEAEARAAENALNSKKFKTIV